MIHHWPNITKPFFFHWCPFKAWLQSLVPKEIPKCSTTVKTRHMDLAFLNMRLENKSEATGEMLIFYDILPVSQESIWLALVNIKKYWSTQLLDRFCLVKWHRGTARPRLAIEGQRRVPNKWTHFFLRNDTCCSSQNPAPKVSRCQKWSANWSGLKRSQWLLKSRFIGT